MQPLDFDLLLHILQDCSGVSQEHLAEWLETDVATISRHMNRMSGWRKTKDLRQQWIVALNKCRESFGNNDELCCKEICRTLNYQYDIDANPYRKIFQERGFPAFAEALVSDAWFEKTREIPTAKNSKNVQIPTASVDDIRVATFQDLLSAGMTPIDIANCLVDNDIKLYRSVFQDRGITEQNEGTAIQWAEYLSSYPMSFQYLVNVKNEIVGNFSFVSITDEMLEKYMDGLIFEENFIPSATRDLFSSGADHILFLLNLSVNDEYATAKNNLLLRRMFLQQLISFAENDAIFFKKIVTNVYKSSQESFYKQWGFSFVKPNVLSGNIYELNMLPYPKALCKRLKTNINLSDLGERLRKSYEQNNAVTVTLDSLRRQTTYSDSYLKEKENQELRTHLKEYEERERDNQQILTLLTQIQEDTRLIPNMDRKLDYLTKITLEQICDEKRKLQNVLTAVKGNTAKQEAELVKFFDGVTEKLNGSLTMQSKNVVETEKAYLKSLFGTYWEQLDNYTKTSLLSSRVFLSNCIDSSQDDLDYSGVVIAVTSALENELKKYFFKGYKGYLQDRFGLPQGSDKKQWPVAMLREINDKETNRVGYTPKKEFSLGMLYHILSGSEEERCTLNEYLYNILAEPWRAQGAQAFLAAETGKSFLSRCEDIRKEYRNRAAHAEPIYRVPAMDCCTAVMGRKEASEYLGEIHGLLYDLSRMLK